MKKIYLILIGCITLGSVNAQSKLYIGGGYFGQNVTHPGVVLETEYETSVSPTLSLPLRLDMGMYNHPRNHAGLFLDASYGLRRYYKSGLFLEEAIGIGVLGSAVNTDVFSVDTQGNVSETSKINTPQITPSLTLGIGYNLTKDASKPSNLIWVRPKILWEIPHKTTASFSAALQIGFTHQINTK